ncbi:tRNA dihydrouridine synthase DusB [Oricola cellulosilytica]|nr:tRNA dihydrouridine synthase DusB [Oricola cellulosilytica]
MNITQPLTVGPVKLRNRVFVAPMSGVTDLPFRERAYGHGAGLVVSEMIASQEYCRARRESRKRAESGTIPVRMLQLAGREAQWMAEAARIAEDEGVDIIDINMGCPAKKVTGGLSGSALMRNLDHAMSLIKSTLAAVRVPVTLKMRLGWDHNSINAPELARRAADAGVQMITVHGRTREQLYRGTADWARVAEVRAAVSIPLVINGDIKSRETADLALIQSGADAVMIGRASYGAPWVAGQIARESGFCDSCAEAVPERAELGGYVAAHYEDMLAHYGVEPGLRHARKHLNWYLDKHTADHPDFERLRRGIMTGTDPRNVLDLIADAFAEPFRPALNAKAA